MEETDPARILPVKKQAVEATSSSGGAVPMVPPMGMPMSPHAPREGQAPVQPLSADDNQLYTADMPAEGFGAPAVTATHQVLPASHDALIPGIPAETAAHAGIPAGMTHSVSSPLIPAIPARPAEPAGDVHILPIEDKPCTCCGKYHDGQENRGFDEDKRRPVEDGEYDHDHASHHRGDDHHTHDDHHRGEHQNGEHHRGDQPGGDRPGGDHIPAGTHDGNGETRPGEVTDPIPTDDKSDRCCACCGDDHPGLDTVTGDKPGTPADDTDDSSNPDDDDCPADDSDDDHGDDRPGHDQDDDHADDGPGKHGEGKDGDDKHGDGKHGEDKHGDGKHGDDKADDDCPADDRHGGDKHGDRPGDKPGDKPGDHRPGDHRPGQDANGSDRPGHDGGTPVTRPVAPGQNTPGQETALERQKAPLAPTDSNVAYDTAKPTTPATPVTASERPTMAAPLQSRLSPTQPHQAGQRVEGEKLTPTSLTPKQQSSSPNPPVTPVTPVTPIVPGATGGSPQTPVTDEPRQFYKSTPPDQQGQNGGEQPLTPTQSFVPAQSQPATEPVQATPANVVAGMRIPGNPAGNGNTNGNGNGNTNGNTNNPFTTSGGGPGGLFPPTDGNVGPDPNVKFDENAYNQLTAIVGEVRATLGKATRDDVTFLDAELLVQPEGQTWTPATKLVQRGGIFGGSVDTESTSLEKTLKTFHESLQLAKEVFKETDDLAAYDASKFTTAYPGFNNGGLPGGSV